MSRDRFRLRNRLRSIEQAEEAGRPFDQNLERLLEDLNKSIAVRKARSERKFTFEFDPALPVNERREEIAAVIAKHQVTILCGETGSGKSTQLPKILLAAGRGVEGTIGHTQPRRIAARSVAARIAEELQVPLGREVGFKIRFQDSTQAETLVKLMTDGVLLAETQTDHRLEQYDTIILDEAHERSLNIDFLLGYLKRLLPQRPDLRVIVTSATIDAVRFAQHFASEAGPAPVIEVSGRAYPVETRYREPAEDEFTGEIDWQRSAADAVDECLASGHGDVLVFLPTEREIRETAQTLRGRLRSAGAIDILPLYARLSTEEQNKIFHPGNARRIVLATNVAESSLTVPRITYVVDTGLARTSRYSAKSKVQRLPIEAISQASADQRRGRCGRIGPGTCIRLFSEEDYLGRERFTTPEIQRTNLAAVVLQTIALQLGGIEEFPFLDPPRAEAVRDGYKTLFELGAVDHERKLTPIGIRLAKLPCDPRIGRMILAADEENCLRETLIIAAALETQDARERPPERREAADQAHSRFQDPDSDFIGFLKLWDFVHDLKSDLSRNQWQRACRQNYLNVFRLREWMETYRQLREIAIGARNENRRNSRNRGEQDDSAAPEHKRNYRERYAPLHRAILCGLLSNLAMRGDSIEYKGSGGTAFHLWPGSGVFSAKPPWIVAAELVETGKRYVRTIANIDPAWVESLAGHLVKSSYSDPHFHRKSKRIMAFERVTLFGLTLVQGRRVNYGPLDHVLSREIFIQQGLVEGEYETGAAFRIHNTKLMERVLQTAAKTRRREYVIDASRQYDFFAARLPADVFDGQSFERWRGTAERANAKILHMSESDLLDAPPEAATEESFPDRFATERLELHLDYRFEPGEKRDGVTLRVPREGLNQLHPEKLGWLVPGLLEEKVAALIRSLPKSMRRNLVPAPDAAKRAAARLKFGEGPFYTLLAAELTREAGETIAPSDFREDQLPEHLRMNVQVIGEEGRTLAEGRDLQELKKKIGVEPTNVITAGPDDRWHRDRITQWNFGELPESLEMTRAGLKVTVYPALLDQGDSVALRLLDLPHKAEHALRLGLLRLFAIAAMKELRAQVAWFPEMERLRVLAASLQRKRDLREDLADLLARRSFLADPLPRSAEQFADRLMVGKRLLPGVVCEIAKWLPALLTGIHEAALTLEKSDGPNRRASLDDARAQFHRLTADGFLISAPDEFVEHMPRYFQGIAARIRKLTTGGLTRDVQAMAQIEPLWKRYTERAARFEEFGFHDPELELYRWMIEELRISLFAQELGTSRPVSVQRLEKQWAKIRNP